MQRIKLDALRQISGFGAAEWGEDDQRAAQGAESEFEERVLQARRREAELDLQACHLAKAAFWAALLPCSGAGATQIRTVGMEQTLSVPTHALTHSLAQALTRFTLTLEKERGRETYSVK